MSGSLTTCTESQPTATQEAPRWGWLLIFYLVLFVLLQGAKWATGLPSYRLAEAIEQGASEVEHQQLGEENLDVVRKAIRMQRDTLPFWRAILALRDFVLAPALLGLRAVAMAVALCAVAATCGRPVRFPEAMYDCVAWQGIWIVGLAVQVLLMVLLDRPTPGAAVLLLLAGDKLPASRWTLLEQIDLFALLGWLGMARGGWRRGQANVVTAILVAVVLAALEIAICSSGSLVVNLGMRATLMGAG